MFVSRALCQPEDLGWRVEVRFGELCITELPNHKWKNVGVDILQVDSGRSLLFLYRSGQRGYLDI